jgi:hypothetical protein
LLFRAYGACILGYDTFTRPDDLDPPGVDQAELIAGPFRKGSRHEKVGRMGLINPQGVIRASRQDEEYRGEKDPG